MACVQETVTFGKQYSAVAARRETLDEVVTKVGV